MYRWRKVKRGNEEHVAQERLATKLCAYTEPLEEVRRQGVLAASKPLYQAVCLWDVSLTCYYVSFSS